MVMMLLILAFNFTCYLTGLALFSYYNGEVWPDPRAYAEQREIHHQWQPGVSTAEHQSIVKQIASELLSFNYLFQTHNWVLSILMLTDRAIFCNGQNGDPSNSGHLYRRTLLWRSQVSAQLFSSLSIHDYFVFLMERRSSNHTSVQCHRRSTLWPPPSGRISSRICPGSAHSANLVLPLQANSSVRDSDLKISCTLLYSTTVKTHKNVSYNTRTEILLKL